MKNLMMIALIVLTTACGKSNHNIPLTYDCEWANGSQITKCENGPYDCTTTFKQEFTCHAKEIDFSCRSSYSSDQNGKIVTQTSSCPGFDFKEILPEVQ